MLQREARYEEALKYAYQLIEMNPRECSDYEWAIDTLYLMKKYGESIRVLEKAFSFMSEQDRCYVYFLQKMGNDLAGQKKWKKALDYFTRALNAAVPGDNVCMGCLHFHRGECYLALKQYDKALDDYREANRIFPELLPEFLSMANALACGQERFKEALYLIDEEKKDRPEGEYYLFSAWGDVLSCRKDFKGAEEKYREAISRNEGYWYLYASLAVALARQGKGQEALAAFKEGEKYSESGKWENLFFWEDLKYLRKIPGFMDYYRAMYLTIPGG
jgi:tetratricopeptide (TPR) repeat protein